MKRAFKWGSIIIVCGLIISGIAYLGHKQPFDPMSPIEESTANRDVLTRKSFNNASPLKCSFHCLSLPPNRILIALITHFTALINHLAAQTRRGTMIIKRPISAINNPR